MSELPQMHDSRNPSDELSKKEFLNDFDRILQSLPPKQKTAFVLGEFEKLPYTQIAQIEGVRVGTIKSRINRAKKKLGLALRNLEAGIL